MIVFLDVEHYGFYSSRSKEKSLSYQVKSLGNMLVKYENGNPYEARTSTKWGRIIEFGGVKTGDNAGMSVSDYFKVLLEVIDLLENRGYIN